MTFEVAVHEEAHATRVAISGEASAGQLGSLMQVLALDSARWRGALLVDLGGLRTRISAPERLRVEEEARKHFRAMRSVEVVWPAL